MISLNEQADIFSSINHDIRKKNTTFIDLLKSLEVTYSNNNYEKLSVEGFSHDSFYYITCGQVRVEHQQKTIFLFEKGDILSTLTYEDYEQADVYLEAKPELEVEVFSILDLQQAFHQDKSLFGSWLSISNFNQLQLYQMLGKLTRAEENATPGFKRFMEGQTIITEGDDADYVYSVTEGTAEVSHKGVAVGEINGDEIFGAIAVLTGEKRTATVIAKTTCTVLMVHKDEFSKMVHSHPRLFLNILESLSGNIKSLNEKVTALAQKTENQ